MRKFLSALLLVAASTLSAVASADDFTDTIAVFQKAGQSADYFRNSYGYAVFPTIGKGGLVVGGAFGRGQVYQGGKRVAGVSMKQVSVGFQVGGQAYSEIIFFESKYSFDDFMSGNFEFGADASAVAITAGASASASSAGGASASASNTQQNAKTAGAGYHHGMAVFTVAKGGFMAQAAISGQKFDITR
jgi:lipid-binding SYLF domain-containing protein